MRKKMSAIIHDWMTREPQVALENHRELARRILAEEPDALGYSLDAVRLKVGRMVRLPQNKAMLESLIEAESADTAQLGEEPKKEKRQFQAGDTVSREELDEETVSIVEDDYQRRFVVTEDGEYAIKMKSGRFRFFPIAMIDDLFKYYSRHGYNYTSTQTIHEFELTPEEFHAIKGAFRLFKDSHVFSPYTWERTPTEEREEMVTGVVQQVMGSHKVTERVYRKQLESKYKQVIKKDHLMMANHHQFLQELAEQLPVAKKSLVVQYTAPNIITQREEIMAAVTDLHTGAFVMGLGITPDFTTDILRRRLKELAYFINTFNAKRVKLAFLGDNIESFTGMNHPNSWQGIQTGLYGAGVVTLAYEVILEFVESVYNVVEIAGVGGNHDRSTSSGKEDTKAEIATILFYFISERLKSTGIKVVYDNDTVSTRLGSRMNAILQHGHLGNARGPMSDTLWDYGIKGCFNFIMQGHLHSRMIKPNNDSLDGRRYICPPMFTGNEYSKKAGFSSSLAGSLIIEENKHGLPRVLDESFL